MLNIHIICVGNLKESYWKAACAEYCKRLTPWAKVKIEELPEERDPGAAQSGAVLEAEGKRIIADIPAHSLVTALCIEGGHCSSEQLAARLSRAMVDGASTAVFIIGSSRGLSDEVKRRADIKLSMSDMTFPHQLARVMLLEQLYRAMSIINNGKYHK